MHQDEGSLGMALCRIVLVLNVGKPRPGPSWPCQMGSSLPSFRGPRVLRSKHLLKYLLWLELLIRKPAKVLMAHCHASSSVVLPFIFCCCVRMFRMRGIIMRTRTWLKQGLPLQVLVKSCIFSRRTGSPPPWKWCLPQRLLMIAWQLSKALF